MNKLYCLIIMLLTCRICEGQNIVPNPNFEDTVACPTMFGQVVNHSVAWSSYRNSPDYFNSCNNGMVGVPYNAVGYQIAHSGNAYAGLCARGYIGQDYREFIGVHLLSPTIIGQKYYAAFYISWSGMPGFTLAVNKLGIVLTTQAYSQSFYYPVTNNPMTYSDSIYSDSTGWSKIQLSFIADSAYQYLVLGNFFDDLQTDTAFGQTNIGAYYYIDDVCLSTDSAYCDTWTSVFNFSEEKDEPGIFSNPFYEEFTVNVKDNQESEIILYNITGTNLLQQKFTNSVSLNTSQLAKGIYIYELRNKNGVIKKGKVVKE